MMFKTKIHFLFSLLLLLMCGPLILFAQQTKDTKGLKDYYKNYFPIGVAITPRHLLDSAERHLILAQFNSVTAENAMKMGPLHPEENKYYWKDADAIVDFAVANGLKVRGHTLCWHTQTPKWLFVDQAGNRVNKEVLLSRLKAHIQTVVKRYKGKIYAWDVVNEAVSDNPKETYRNSPWYEICGEDYIAKAFEYAHEADPDAILFYNDYNTEHAGKRSRIYALLKKLRDQGLPVHAVGLQGHWSVNDPTPALLQEAIDQYTSLGLKVQITELDVSIYTDNKESPVGNAGLTPTANQMLTDQYRKIFKVFRMNKDKLTGVTFWNLSDKHSWLDNFPVRGRKNYPLLFDQKLQPKDAYWGVVKF